MESLAASLAPSPELFPLAFDPATDQVTFIRLSEAEYRQASFLDARLLTPRTLRRTLPTPEIQAAVAAAALSETANYIFHLGHVGSTLLSRLLGAHPHIFALREPAILRTFVQMRFDPPRAGFRWADAEIDDWLDAVLKLLSRTFSREQRALVKATSFVSELAKPILARQSRPKAIFMFVGAETYLATILSAPNSPKEARLLAESRLARLHGRIGEVRWRLPELSEGETVAMSWACEITALSEAAKAAREQVLWLNFDEFLDSPARWLGAAFAHLGIEATSAQVDTIVAGPEMGRYSKAPEHIFDAKLRRVLLRNARRDHAMQIENGLRWLKEAEAAVPILQESFVDGRN